MIRVWVQAYKANGHVETIKSIPNIGAGEKK